MMACDFHFVLLFYVSMFICVKGRNAFWQKMYSNDQLCHLFLVFILEFLKKKPCNFEAF